MQGRSRSRSPVRNLISDQSDIFVPTNISSDCIYLFVGNIPLHWNYVKIKEFLSKQCNSTSLIRSLKFITVMKDSNNLSKGECVMEFSSVGACLMALKALRGAEVDGKKIVAMPDSGIILLSTNNGNTKAKGLRKSKLSDKQQYPNVPLPEPMLKSPVTFGLSLNFLNNLKIKLPLKKQIFVHNLDAEVNESTLREVFGYAGHVLMIAMKKKGDKNMAKIEYDHPVEAVQAISMFNDQELFGKKMLVQMDDQAHLKQPLPQGLTKIGPGLGPNGEPLRGIRNLLEMEPIKEMMQELVKIQVSKTENDGNTNNQSADMSMDLMLHNMQMNAMSNAYSGSISQPMLGVGILGQAPNMQMYQNVPQNRPLFPSTMTDFQTPMTNMTANIMGVQNDIMAPVPQMVANPYVNNMNTQFNQLAKSQLPASQLANPYNINTQSNTSQLANPYNMSQNQYGDLNSWTTAPSDWSQYYTQQKDTSREQSNKNSHDGNGSYNTPKYKDMNTRNDNEDIIIKSEETNVMTSSDMLVFKNLPASVTEKALITKMREVGAVRFAEITGQGRAIVRFCDTHDAEQCIKLFDRSKVDGQTIFVRFF